MMSVWNIRESCDSLTFLLGWRHEHDGHVEAAHGRQTAEDLQNDRRRFVPEHDTGILGFK